MWNWFWAIPIIIVLRAADFISNIWVGFAILALAGAVALIQLLPAFRRFATVIFIGWVAIFIALPTLWGGILERFPRIRQATQQRTVWTDIEGAEQGRVHGLQEYVVLRRLCDTFERMEAAKADAAASALERLLERRAISREDFEKKHEALAGQIRRDIAFREKCLKLRADENGEQPGISGSVGKWLRGALDLGGRELFWLTVLGLVLAMLLAWIFRRTRFLTFVWVGALIIIGALLLDEAVWKEKPMPPPPATVPRAEAAPRPPRYVGPPRPTEPEREIETRRMRATRVVPLGPSAWAVSIDGTNGKNKEAIGHRTTIMVPPGATARIQRVSGALAYDKDGRSIGVCGAEPQKGVKVPLPAIRPYAIALVFVQPPYYFEPLGWRCGRDVEGVRNESTTPLELVFLFNGDVTKFVRDRAYAEWARMDFRVELE